MFVNEVFEALQDSFRAAHKEYPFPNKQLEDAPVKFQAAIGEFTIRLNSVLRDELKSNNKNIARIYTAEKKDLQTHKALLAMFLGISVAVNIALLIS